MQTIIRGTIGIITLATCCLITWPAHAQDGLPSDLQPTNLAALPASADLFYLSQWPDSPPVPVGILSVEPPDPLYWSPSLQAAFLDDRQPASTRMPGRSITMDVPDPGDGGGDGGGDSGGGGGFPQPNYPAGSLWLEITNVDSALAYLNLHGATNLVYSIWTTTNLPTPWQFQTAVWPTNQDVMPFTVPTLGWQNLFIRAQDWSTVDSDADGIPDWWIWLYYGNFNQSATNFDTQGHTLGDDYANNVAPQVFNFTGLEVTNNSVSSSVVPVQLDVTGSPFYIAALVDDTNYADAVWTAFTTPAVEVNLGSTEGWHEVRVGLLAHADPPAAAVWQWKRLKLDFTPPALVLTGPTNSTVMVPLIQLTGYSSEALSALTYDLSNASGTITGQQAVVTGQFYSTNTAEFTTNYLQCYDVSLANGLNVITLHAIDWAGNMAALSTNITCSPSTNPPVVDLLWPLDSMQISGSSFTIKGQVDDPTATVSVSITDTNGNTSNLSGRTGRDGIFWVENVPLSPGTNSLALTLTTPAGSTTVNSTLIQSSVGLSINAVQAGDTTAAGAIDTDGYAIWVNGTQATPDEENWTAPIAPIGIGGGLVLVTAIPNSDNGGFGTGGGSGVNPTSTQSINAQATVQPPQGVFISAYNSTDRTDYQSPGGSSYDILNWQDGRAGNAESFFYEDWDTWFPTFIDDTWPATSWPQTPPDGTETAIFWNYNPNYPHDPSTTLISAIASPSLPIEHCDITQTIDSYGSTERRTADTELKLVAGGPLASIQENLWLISATATAYTNAQDTIGVRVPPEQIQVGTFGRLDTNGNLYLALPGSSTVNLAIHAPGDHYTVTILQQRYTPYLLANGSDLRTSEPEFCAGQQVTNELRFDPPLPPEASTQYHWYFQPSYANLVVIPADTNASPSYTQDPNLKTNATAPLWWLDPGTKLSGCNFSVSIDGRSLALSTHGFVHLVMPTFVSLESTCPGVHFLNPNSSGDQELAVTDTNGSVGMQWTVTLKRPDRFGGQAWYTQLVNRYIHYDRPLWTDYVSSTDNEFWLDNVTPYMPPVDFQLGTRTNKPVYHADSPGVLKHQFSSIVEAQDDFHTYLRFQPATPNSIPVTVGRLDWGWHGGAQYNFQTNAWTAPITTWYGPNPDWSDHTTVTWSKTYRNDE